MMPAAHSLSPNLGEPAIMDLSMFVNNLSVLYGMLPFDTEKLESVASRSTHRGMSTMSFLSHVTFPSSSTSSMHLSFNAVKIALRVQSHI